MSINTTILGTPSFRRVNSSISSTVYELVRLLDALAIRTIHSIANKIDAFPQSYPKTMQVLEPVICSVFRFSNNFPTLSLVTEHILWLSLISIIPSIPLPIALAVLICQIIYLFSRLILSLFILPELVDRQLNQAVNINKMTASYLNLDSNFVSKLNIWTNETRVLNGDWRRVQRTIIGSYRDQTLNLRNHELRSLPDIFDTLIFENTLEDLNLRNNQLTTLPSSIGNLSSLRSLDLRNNPTLSVLPEEILELPSSCTVNIENCNFPETVFDRIRDIANNPNYTGPTIRYSMVRLRPMPALTRYDYLMATLSPTLRTDTRFDEIGPSIEQSLRNLYTISGMAYRELSNIKELPNLKMWLSKLSLTADFRGSSRAIVATKIIGYLERSNEDTSFRDIFSATISDAVNSCGDKVALSILKLGVTYKLSTIDLRDMGNLNYLLTRGVWALDLLHEIAQQKIKTLRFVDETEVYLAYPVKLKEALNLPIDIEDMLYFSFSELTPRDLQFAKESVLSTIAKEEEHVAFLIEQPQWIEALKLNYTEQFTAIETKKDNALDVDDPNYVRINNTYNQDLTDLTKQVLNI